MQPMGRADLPCGSRSLGLRDRADPYLHWSLRDVAKNPLGSRARKSNRQGRVLAGPCPRFAAGRTNPVDL